VLGGSLSQYGRRTALTIAAFQGMIVVVHVFMLKQRFRGASAAADAQYPEFIGSVCFLTDRSFYFS